MGRTAATATTPIFVYGTLQYPSILNILLRRVPATTPATVSGFRRVRILNQPYPAVLADPGSSVDGVLLSGLREDELEVMHDYEGEEYVLHGGVEAVTDAGPVECALYLWGDAYLDRLLQPLEPWDQSAFERNDLDRFAGMLRGYYEEK